MQKNTVSVGHPPQRKAGNIHGDVFVLWKEAIPYRFSSSGLSDTEGFVGGRSIAKGLELTNRVRTGL